LGETLSWVVTLVGLFGFWLAGRKVWWAWYVNIANQLAWVAFALVTDYYAFLLGTVFYLVVFIRNAYLWTTEHFDAPILEALNRMTKADAHARRPVIGEMLEIRYDVGRGVEATFRLNDKGLEMMKAGKINGLLVQPFDIGHTITTDLPEE
jgi:hypothetical protein